MPENESVTLMLPKYRGFEYTGEFRPPDVGDYFLSRDGGGGTI